MRRTYIYAAKSGTSTLRGHVDRWHVHEYLELVEARGWPVWIETVKKAIKLGYTIGELQQVMTESGTLEGLRARAGQMGTPDADGRCSLSV